MQRKYNVSEYYLTLQKKDQSQILQALSTNKNIKREAYLLEKDIWICWTLEFLFKMPNRLPMAFKGGTSLSKVYQVIDRFSEDIDITVDYRAFNCEDPLAEGVSKTKVKNISFQIKSMLTEYIKNTLIPYYENVIAEQFTDNAPFVELDNDGETLHLRYPSVIEQKNGYILDSVRLEFGGRNLTIPSDTITITSDISGYVNDLLFPVAQATVLSPQKTYWEKLTLIHSECNRPTLKDDANRISRHWYDIVMLTNHDIGQQAIVNRELLQEVIKIKKLFYNSSYANYDACLMGKFCLIPNKDHLKLLKDDFYKMIENKMFYGVQPDFDNIINQIIKLQERINMH